MIQLVLGVEPRMDPRAVVLLPIEGTERGELMHLQKVTQSATGSVEVLEAIRPDRASAGMRPDITPNGTTPVIIGFGIHWHSTIGTMPFSVLVDSAGSGTCMTLPVVGFFLSDSRNRKRWLDP